MRHTEQGVNLKGWWRSRTFHQLINTHRVMNRFDLPNYSYRPRKRHQLRMAM